MGSLCAPEYQGPDDRLDAAMRANLTLLDDDDIDEEAAQREALAEQDRLNEELNEKAKRQAEEKVKLEKQLMARKAAEKEAKKKRALEKKRREKREAQKRREEEEKKRKEEEEAQQKEEEGGTKNQKKGMKESTASLKKTIEKNEEKTKANLDHTESKGETHNDGDLEGVDIVLNRKNTLSYGEMSVNLQKLYFQRPSSCCHDKSLMEGELLLKNTRKIPGFGSSRIPRYVMLFSNCIVAYRQYHKTGHTTRPDAVMDITHISRVVVRTGSEEKFTIAPAEGAAVWDVRADTSEDRNKWMTAIQTVVNEKLSQVINQYQEDKAAHERAKKEAADALERAAKEMEDEESDSD